MPSLKLRLISATHKLPWNRSPQALISLRAKPSKSKWTIYNTFSGAASAIEEDSSFDTRLVKRELILWLKKERYPWEHEMHYCHLVTAQMRSPGVAWCSWTQDTPQQWDRWPMTRSLQGQRYGVYPEHEMPSRVSPCLQETQLLGWGWVLEFRYHCLFDMVALVRLCLGAPQASMARDCMWNNDSIIFHRDHRYNFSHF